MIDSVVYLERLPGVANRMIQESDGKKRSYKLHITNRPPVSQFIKSQVEKKTLARTRGHYPAPLKALEVVYASLNVSHEQSLANEKNSFVELALHRDGAKSNRALLPAGAGQETQAPGGSSTGGGNAGENDKERFGRWGRADGGWHRAMAEQSRDSRSA